MITIDLPRAPDVITWQSPSKGGRFETPLVASAQTLPRYLKWRAVLTYSNLTLDDRALLEALVVELSNLDNRVRIPAYSNPARGTYGGTPLVEGGAQTGKSLNIDGVSLSVTNWIRRGDWFSVDVGGEHELKRCMADANSDGTGDVTVTFEPALRDSPGDDAVVFVEDGVLQRPEGIFYFENNVNGYSARPGRADALTDMVLLLVEDVFATQ